MSADAQPAGTVECADYTRGHRARMTMSRIGNWSAWWGRQDIAVYIAAFVLLLLTVASRGLWLPVVFHVADGPAVVLVVLLAFLGPPVIAGVVASMTGLNARDILPGVAALAAMIPRPGTNGLASGGMIRPEPRVRMRGARARTWVIRS